MLTNETPQLDTPEAIARDVTSGNSHFRAWCAITEVLYEVSPEWNANERLTAVQNACNAIRALAQRS